MDINLVKYGISYNNKNNKMLYYVKTTKVKLHTI